MQTPAPTPAQVAVEQLPTAPPPPATPVLAGQATSIGALQERVMAYAQELAGLKAQRVVLQRQIHRASDPVIRASLELRAAPLENQIAQADMNLASARAELASRQGQETQPPPGFPPGANRQFDPDLVAGLMFAFIFAVLMPMSIAIARRIWRGRSKDTVPRADDVIAPRLDRLEQAVDAIAIEIERISEGQRFVTRVLAERPVPVSKVEPQSSELAEGKPALALGAGAAAPIRVAERQGVRQVNRS